MKAKALLAIPSAIEANLNPGFVVIRTFADGNPEPFSEHLPKAADEANTFAGLDRARAEAAGVGSLEIISWDGDTGRTRSYTALVRVDHEAWHCLANWRAPETDG